MESDTDRYLGTVMRVLASLTLFLSKQIGTLSIVTKDVCGALTPFLTSFGICPEKGRLLQPEKTGREVKNCPRGLRYFTTTCAVSNGELAASARAAAAHATVAAS